MTFSWNLFGSLSNKCITADGYGYGSGYRQHHWGKGGQGWGEHGFPNLNWALAWEGHAGMHFFTRFPKGVTNPFILSLPEGFVINRKWWGQDGAHWAATHDLRFEGTHFNKKIVVVGDGFKTGCFLWWDGNKEKGTWIVRSWPQYAVAVPKGNDHVWYRAAFQWELNDGSYYSGYWEMESQVSGQNLTTYGLGILSTGFLKWMSISGNPLTRCPTHTSSNSGPRPGIPRP